MPDDRKIELKAEIGHVLFLDIVGYSTLLINEQSELLRDLNEIVRGTEEFREVHAAGSLLRLPTGDGMALVFRDNPEAPARCALQISQALKTHPELPVRMGIHSGPVNRVTDVDERSNVAGAGINVAQRVMNCGDAGHILLSRRAADDLSTYRHWQLLLHDLGEIEVKHGATIGIVSLYNDELGNAAVPERLRAKQVSPAAAKGRHPSSGKWIGLAAALVVVLVTG